MLSVIFMIQAALTALNVGLFVANGSPFSAAAAVFCGLLAAATALLWVREA